MSKKLNLLLILTAIFIVLCSFSNGNKIKRKCTYRELKRLVKNEWHYDSTQKAYKSDTAFITNLYRKGFEDCFKGLSKKRVIALFGQPSHMEKYKLFYCTTSTCDYVFHLGSWYSVFWVFNFNEKGELLNIDYNYPGHQ